MAKPDSKTGCRQRLTGTVTRVLIVDDHALLREGMKELLNGEPNLEVCGEASGETEAMELVRARHPELVIIDVALEQGNGLDLVKRIKTHDTSIRMIVCSMYEDTLYAERAVRLGALGYVNKQSPAPTILEAIAQVLAGGIYLSGPMTQRWLRGAAGSKDDPTKSLVESLSDRELQVFGLMGQGLTNSQIAQRLHVSNRTIDTYRVRIKAKLNLQNTSELHRDATQFWLQQGREG